MNKYKTLTVSVVLIASSIVAQSLSAVNDNVRIKEDTPQLIDVLKNDKVTNRQDLEITIIQNPNRGTSVLRGNNIYYTPNQDQNGIDELIYIVDTGFSIDTAKVVIRITEVNDPPVKVELLDNTVPENILTNTKIGELSTVDPDGNDEFKYSFINTGQNDNKLFSLQNGILYTDKSFDFEKKKSYQIKVQSKDRNNASVTTTVKIDVIDVNEAPYFKGVKDQKFTFPEQSGKLIGMLDVIDPDEDQDNARFKIVGGADQRSFKITQLGELSFVREPDYEKPLDQNGDNTYIVNYMAIDSKNKNLSTTGSAQITIKDAEEKPIASLDKRKFIAWTVDHMPYHILMEDAIIDYNNLNAEEYSKSIKQKKKVSENTLWLPELKPDDELIIVQKKANNEEIHEIWYGNGLTYNIIKRDQVDWVLSQDIQQVLIERDQYLNSASETVFYESEDERLLASFSSKFAVWDKQNFIISNDRLFLKSNVMQYGANFSTGNSIIGLPGSLYGAISIGAVTKNSEIGIRLPAKMNLLSMGSLDKPNYLGGDYMGLYSKASIENMFSTRAAFHAQLGFSFYPRSDAEIIDEISDFKKYGIVDSVNKYINMIDMYALMATTFELPIVIPYVAKVNASPGISYIKIAHRSLKVDDDKKTYYERNFYDYNEETKKYNRYEDGKSSTRNFGVYARFDFLGEIGQKPDFIERVSFFNFVRISRVPFFEYSFQWISSLNTLSSLTININDNIGFSITNYSTSPSLKGDWLPKKNIWLGFRYTGEF
ncbi:MAG: cadherin domain-containing protein [Candidatus Neomarinimicrobiota bacterium]|nr:cadherin domain-containing protein [Candidatus Neomarinimicrobiota bacterium]